MEDFKLIELSNIPGVEILMETKMLFERVMRDNINSADLMIRILAIENYYGKNDFGFDLYRRMQETRVRNKPEISRHMEKHEEEFKLLIRNIEKNGFDKRYPVELNKNFEVFDGSHRLATAIYFGIPKIHVKFNQKYYDKEFDYSPKWFEENGLADLVPHIISKYDELIKNNCNMSQN